MEKEKSCGAIVYKEYGKNIKYLVIKHKGSGHWGFPKGHVELGENEFETALRETLEETGLEVKLEKDFRFKLEYFPKKEVLKEVIFFIGKTENENVICQPQEIDDYKWVYIDDAMRILTHENSRKLLISANEFLNK